MAKEKARTPSEEKSVDNVRALIEASSAFSLLVGLGVPRDRLLRAAFGLAAAVRLQRPASAFGPSVKEIRRIERDLDDIASRIEVWIPPEFIEKNPEQRPAIYRAASESLRLSADGQRWTFPRGLTARKAAENVILAMVREQAGRAKIAQVCALINAVYVAAGRPTLTADEDELEKRLRRNPWQNVLAQHTVARAENRARAPK